MRLFNGILKQAKAKYEVQSPDNDGREEEKMSNRVWNKFFEGKSAAWTAAFTGVLTLFTCGLVFLAKNANDVAVQTQRAFISFSPTVPGQKIANGGKVIGIAFAVSAFNSGTTPTNRAVGRINIQPWSSELPSAFDFKDLSSGKSLEAVIGPKDSVHYTVAAALDDILAIRDKGYHIYTWGWMHYRDTFKGTPDRLTEYCFEFVNINITKSDGITPATDFTDRTNNFTWDLNPCPVPHNCYDEDCKDYSERIKAN